MTQHMVCPACSTPVCLTASEQVPTHVGTTPRKLCPTSGWCAVTGPDGKPTLSDNWRRVQRGLNGNR